IRLVSCFPFNGNANDSKGLNNSTVSGATLTTDRYGNANSAYSFGVNDKIETQVNTFNYQNFSISIWLNLYSVPQNPPYTYSLIKLNTFEILMSNSLYNNNSRAYSFMFRGLFSNIPTQILDNARWYNVVITKNENNYNFFINGQLISSFIDNVNTIDFGNFQTSFGKTTYQGWEYPFQGKIDDVQIYKGALTAGQVRALYQNQNSCFDATTYTCLSNITYNSILNGQQTLQVSNQIIGSSTIQTGSNIHFDSKNSVILQPGFKTEANTVFRASAGGGCN
ncbi:MAG: LamG domain-containing protein, partial [Emticicia sp.]|uniref:LamG domain-containing protein n=1 Tax=Emticicia sp. TaxID=1930953 RepID=UPI003BA7A571